MTIIDDLCDDSVWDDFLIRKEAQANKKDVEVLEDFIKNRRYKTIVKEIRDGTYRFRPVRRLEIPKQGSDEKRVVYTCKRQDISEHMVLRVFADLLQRYDGIFSDNLYSFRNEGGVQKAVARMRNIECLGNMYSYKADITKYFNSINQERMRFVLDRSEVDESAVKLIQSIIENPEVDFEGQIITDNNRGIMPGLPFSTFLSNLYLRDMDIYFRDMGVQYYRFADDILILSESKEELDRHVAYVKRFLKSSGLEINPEKEFFYDPHSLIEFLGLYIRDGIFDINDKSLKRSLRKIRIEGRHYRKTVETGEKSVDQAVHCFLVKMDHRFFGWEQNSKACWSHWYFPLINTDKSLKIIDKQIQDWIRYIMLGCHVKRNRYRIPYKILKKHGYRTLVSRFYDRRYKSQSDNIGGRGV